VDPLRSGARVSEAEISLPGMRFMTDTEQKQNGTPETAGQGTISPGDRGIGALLREERERRGLSYRAVAERTRLRPHFLEALEKEEWDALPPPAFLKGFLRTYSRLLSLDERAVLGLYERAVPAKDADLSPLIEKPGAGKKRRFLLVLCMLVAVAALVFTWKEYVSRVAGPGPEEKERPAAEGEVLQDKAKPPLPEIPRAEPVAPPVVPESHPEVATIPAPVSIPPVSIPPVERRGAASAITDTSQVGVHILRASVSARTWMRVRIDDAETREYMFQPGNRPEWKARQSFSLIIGNAGGVDLNFDGKDMAKLGGSGQVVRLRLPGDSTQARGED
jgi:cytoskeleton protein RodZ